MSNACKDLLWLLSGGVDSTIRQRNKLKEQLAATEAELNESRKRVSALEENLKSSVSDHQLPFILLVALPKSASEYLAKVLHQGLNIPYKEISSGYFPLDVMDFQKLSHLSTGKSLSKAHLDANPMNLQLLRKFCPRTVLHLRDPRQALLSMAHHLKHFLDIGDLQHMQRWIAPAPTVNVLRGSFSGTIDWLLANHLQNMLEWMEHWLAHAESGEKPDVLVTHYHDLHENTQNVVERILDFYQIPAWAFTHADVPKNWSVHFRKGELEEWREVFNSDQQKICSEQMARYPRVNRLYGEKKADLRVWQPEKVAS